MLNDLAAADHRPRRSGDRGTDDVRWLLHAVRPELWIMAIDYWSAWLIASGARERTVELRRYQLGCVAAAHLDRSPWKLTTAELVTWLAGHDWAPETRKSYRAALRSFYGWAVTAGETRHNPAVGLHPVRVPPAPPRPTPEPVLAAAVAAATDRDRLILVLGAYQGMRRAEIATLPWADVDFDSDTIRVVGKGGRVRTLPLHPVAREQLHAEHRRRLAGRTGSGYRFPGQLQLWVFPGQHGGHLKPAAVGIAASRALEAHWTGHTLRHRFATRALAGSGNLLAVQELLGHASLTTTQRYTQLADDARAAAVRAV